LGRVGAARYIKTEDIDLLITDTAADPKLVKRLNNQGVEVKRV
jgi:DeoR/GlpR family transcriptional regulator of sugar metabolism